MAGGAEAIELLYWERNVGCRNALCDGDGQPRHRSRLVTGAFRASLRLMVYRIDEDELVQALDRRVLATLPGTARTWSIRDHLDYLHSLELAALPREAVLAAIVESANDALYQFSDDVSEDAREPYNGCAAIHGDLLRVRFGRVPRSNPDAGDLADELDPIPIDDILIED